MLTEKTYKTVSDALDKAEDAMRVEKLTEEEDRRIRDRLFHLNGRVRKRAKQAQALRWESKRV
jgi:hypothetical protein